MKAKLSLRVTKRGGFLVVWLEGLKYERWELIYELI